MREDSGHGGRRYGSAVGLSAEHHARYIELHETVWPEVLATLTRAHIEDYSIFLFGEVLFSTYRYTGADHAADQALIATDPATQRWWALTDPLQTRLPGTPGDEQWLPLRELFHLD